MATVNLMIRGMNGYGLELAVAGARLPFTGDPGGADVLIKETP
jgi:hypothetical protein